MRRNRRLLLFVPAAAVALAGCVHTEPFRDARGNVLPGSIATMEKVRLGGVSQRIWIRGERASNPALILLHGGPGASENALFRHYDAALEKSYLVVYWDQRGAGRSYHGGIPPESMTIPQFLDDLDALVDLVARRFGKSRVLLLGHSWGSALGILYAHAHPERVAAFIGAGQVADMPEGERVSYEFALAQAREREDASAIAELETIGPPPHDVDAMLTSRKWVERFGGSFRADLSTGALIWAALQEDEVNLVDLYKFGAGNRFSLERLWPAFSRLDLTPVRAFEIPVFFLLGRYDEQVPARVAARYFETIEAPCKRLFWFEGSAHNLPFEEPARFVEVVAGEIPALLASAECAGRDGRTERTTGRSRG